MSSSETSPLHTFSDYWEWWDYALAHRLTDGLAVAPPTTERVHAILDKGGWEPDDELGEIPPSGGILTAELLAVQCAMAGCAPEHAPVVAAAVDAMLDPQFNLHGVQSTSNPCAPLVIVTGPVVEELDFNAAEGSFGGGGHANAAVGRATRLVLWNVGRAYPGQEDMSPHGDPAKYGFCVPEHLAASPWPSMSNRFGIADDEDGVIVFACQSPTGIGGMGTAERILGMLKLTIPAPGISTIFWAAGQYMLVLSPWVATTFSDAGYSEQDLRMWLYDNARYNLGALRAANVLVEDQPVQYYWSAVPGAPDLRDLPDSTELPMVEDPEDIHILVTGGTGTPPWMSYSVGWGNSGGLATARRIAR